MKSRTSSGMRGGILRAWRWIRGLKPTGLQSGPVAENGAQTKPERDEIMEALENVIDPELGLDFVSLGLVYEVEIEGGDVYVTFTLTTPACPIGPQVTEQIQEFVSEVDGVE